MIGAPTRRQREIVDHFQFWIKIEQGYNCVWLSAVMMKCCKIVFTCSCFGLKCNYRVLIAQKHLHKGWLSGLPSSSFWLVGLVTRKTKQKNKTKHVSCLVSLYKKLWASCPHFRPVLSFLPLSVGQDPFLGFFSSGSTTSHSCTINMLVDLGLGILPNFSPLSVIWG